MGRGGVLALEHFFTIDRLLAPGGMDPARGLSGPLSGSDQAARLQPQGPQPPDTL
jgi:hypothetical protein